MESNTPQSTALNNDTVQYCISFTVAFKTNANQKRECFTSLIAGLLKFKSLAVMRLTTFHEYLRSIYSTQLECFSVGYPLIVSNCSPLRLAASSRHYIVLISSCSTKSFDHTSTNSITSVL